MTSAPDISDIARAEEVIGYLMANRRTEFEIYADEMTEEEQRRNLDESFVLCAAKSILVREGLRIMKAELGE